MRAGATVQLTENFKASATVCWLTSALVRETWRIFAVVVVVVADNLMILS